MRQKRAKSYKKQLNVYVHAFKFREPYQILIDAELILTCQKASFDIVKGLKRTIQAECKPMVTQCCMQALYTAGNQDAISIAKTFERRRCNHQPTAPETPTNCMESIVNVNGENKHRYVVASQEQDLRKKLRRVPGVPIIFMNRSVMVMEPLSAASAQFSDKFESLKLTHGLNQTYKPKPKAVAAVFEESADTNGTEAALVASKKRIGPKAPNPLSMKRKKKAEAKPTQLQEPPAKRRRKHKSSGSKSEEDKEASNERAPKEHETATE